MCRLTMVGAALCAFLAGCGRATTPETVTARKPVVGVAGETGESAANASAMTDDFRVGAPLQHKNLTVFPVVSRTPRTEDRFLTLDEGLADGTVQIRELGAAMEGEPAETREETDGQNDILFGNDVNRLSVVNLSPKPLYLMPGEVIVGGSQDRTIAEEVVIAPSKKPVPIDVYCVEHGRWAARDEAESSSVVGAVASAGVTARFMATKSQAGEFSGKAGYLNKKNRLAAQSQAGQGVVWNNVALANAASGVQPTSGTFTGNYADPHVADQLSAYTDRLEKSLADEEQVVGVIVAVNGKVESVDVFESTPLFRKVWPKLLKSFALDAVHQSKQAKADSTCTVADAEAFLKETRQGTSQKMNKSEGGLMVTRHETRRVVSFSSQQGDADGDDTPAAGFGGIGGYGGAVHTSGFSK